MDIWECGLEKFFSFHVIANVPAATGGKSSRSKLGKATARVLYPSIQLFNGI
ncbi:MAG: hypothetical protein ABFS56_07930 [Pseudomonadota bacterium]